jgi:formylglycine-generating enzyme required for sulfatase activity
LPVGTGSEVGWQAAWGDAIGRDYRWDNTIGTNGTFVGSGDAPLSLQSWANRLCGDLRGTGTFTASPGSNERLPMNCVNWFEAQAFCIWDGGFLPSNAEWSHAGSGGALSRLYPWGSTTPDRTLASCFTCGYNLIEVGSRPLGDGFFGQSDMAGNVYEWAYDAYRVTPPTCTDCATDQATLADTGRYFRGGAWNTSTTALQVMNSVNLNYYPAYRDTQKGVRCARTPELTGE